MEGVFVQLASVSVEIMDNFMVMTVVTEMEVLVVVEMVECNEVLHGNIRTE